MVLYPDEILRTYYKLALISGLVPGFTNKKAVPVTRNGFIFKLIDYSTITFLTRRSPAVLVMVTV
jgi:hypothetical protein